MEITKDLEIEIHQIAKQRVDDELRGVALPAIGAHIIRQKAFILAVKCITAGYLLARTTDTIKGN